MEKVLNLTQAHQSIAEKERHIEILQDKLKNVVGINVHRGEIYWAELGQRVGSEQGGTRPVVVVQNDTGNKYSTTIIVAPVTKNLKNKDFCTHVKIKNPITEVECIVLLEQLITIDKQRVNGYLGKLPKEKIEEVNRKIKISLGLK